MEKEIMEVANKLSDQINQAILDKNFVKSKSSSKHTVKIRACDCTVLIWMANDPEDTGVYSIITPSFSLDAIGLSIKPFKKAATCRKILSAKTEAEIMEELRFVEKEIDELRERQECLSKLQQSK